MSWKERDPRQLFIRRGTFTDGFGKWKIASFFLVRKWSGNTCTGIDCRITWKIPELLDPTREAVFLSRGRRKWSCGLFFASGDFDFVHGSALRIISVLYQNSLSRSVVVKFLPVARHLSIPSWVRADFLSETSNSGAALSPFQKTN